MWNFFGSNRLFKKVKTRSGNTDGVFFDSKRQTVDLRKKKRSITIEIDPFISYIKRHSKIIAVVLILACTLFSLNLSNKAEAEAVIFNPKTCLGGWKNPGLATGKADVEDHAYNFNHENSAVLGNESAEIYCGEFEGKFPEDTSPKKITLNFSWLIEGFQNPVVDATSTVLVYPDSFASSSVEIIDLPEDMIAESKTIFVETSETVSTTTVDIVLPPEDEPLKETESPAAEPAEDLPVSFLFKKALAAEVEPESFFEVATTTTAAPDILIIDEIITAIEIGTTTELATTSEINPETDGEIVSIESFDKLENLPLLEVSYTTNGTDWALLGTVNESNFRNTSFEIPISAASSWIDMKNIQVRVKSLPRAETPTIFIDNISLSVTYENFFQGEFVKPELVFHSLQTVSGESVAQIESLDGRQMLKVVGRQSGVAVFDLKSKAVVFTTVIDENYIQIEASHLPYAGDFVLVSTDHPNWCTLLNLDECRADPLYLGEILFSARELPLITETPVEIVKDDISIPEDSTIDSEIKNSSSTEITLTE